MRQRFFIIITTFLMAILVGATIHAQRGGPNRPGGPGPGNEGAPAVQQPPDGRGGPGPQGGPGRAAGPRAGGLLLGPGVDLTDDQRAKVQDIVRGGRDESAAISDELQFVRRNLHREIFADTRNAARVTELTTRIVALEKQLLDIHVKSQTAVAALLTPEQRQSVRAARADRPGGFGGPSGRGGRRAGPAVAQ